MSYNQFSIRAKVWLYPGKAGWYFVTIPKKFVKDIDLFSHLKRGWGSLRVKVTIGHTTWDTSIFPDKKSDSYLLPIKSSIRQSEGIKVDQTIDFNLEIIDH